MEERFRLQRAEQLQEERRQRPGDRLAERSRMPWFILVTCKSVKHYRGPSIWGVSQPQPFPFQNSNIRSASWKGGSCGNPVTSGADWSCCSSNCKLLQVAWTSSGAIWQRLWRSFVMFCVFLAFVCNLEDLFNPITLSYLVLGGATCIIQVESWYVPLWSSSHLSVKMTKKLSLDFLFHPFSIVSQDKTLPNMSWRQNQTYFGISPHCCLSAVKQFVHCTWRETRN